MKNNAMWCDKKKNGLYFNTFINGSMTTVHSSQHCMEDTSQSNKYLGLQSIKKCKFNEIQLIFLKVLANQQQ